MGHAEQYGGLDKAAPRRILDRAERTAKNPQHSDAMVACLRLAIEYGGAVWSAFLDGESRDAYSQACATGNILLARIEGLGGAALDLALQFIVLRSIEKPRLAFTPSGAGQDQVAPSLDSVSGRFWQYLSAFGNSTAARRAACARAMRSAWLWLDEHCAPDGPNLVQCTPLLLPIGVAPSHLKQPELETPAILSGTWVHRPLDGLHVNASGDASEKAPSVEEVLKELAQLLATAPSRVAVDDSDLCEVTVAGRLTGDAVAAEAVLLRAPPEAAQQLALFLASRQGVHDGRAHPILVGLSEKPTDQEARRAYARLTIGAPWRAIREDPTLIAAWAWRARFGSAAFPSGISDLRKLLSEPPGNLDPESSLWDLLGGRAATGGAWIERADLQALFLQATEVPGLLTAAGVGLRLAEVHREERLQEALWRIEHPHDHPAARLAGDVFLLYTALATGVDGLRETGKLNLRERLPEALLHLLRSTTSSGAGSSAEPSAQGIRTLTAPPRETLASAETDLLRVCAKTVRDLCHRQALPFRDGLFLTYRLFQWLQAQLESMAPSARVAGLQGLRRLAPSVESPVPGAEDALNPFGLESGDLAYRVSTILFALVHVNEVIGLVTREATGGEGPVQSNPVLIESLAVEDLLIAWAERPLTDRDLMLRAKGDTPSALAWPGPAALPDLAMSALLALSPKAFFRMSSESRLGWIRDLPSTENKATGLGPLLTGRLLGVVAVHATQLSADERNAVEDRLRALPMEADERVPSWKWLGLTQLFAAGQDNLEQEVLQLLFERIADRAAPAAFAGYLLGLARLDADRLEVEAERVRERAVAAAVDPNPFTSVLASALDALSKLRLE